MFEDQHFAVNIQVILTELDWSDVLQAEDADYQLRFLDDSYSSWLPALERVCCDEEEDFDKRRWCFEAILRIGPSTACAHTAATCLRSSKDWFLRAVPWIARSLWGGSRLP